MKTMYQICFLLILSTFLLAGCNGGSNNKESEQSREQSAIDILTQKIQEQPQNPELYFARGKAYYEKDGYDEAIADFNKAISLDSTKAEYYHELADTYLDYYKSYPALKTMELAAQKFPKNIPTLLKLAEYQLILKQHEESFQTIDQILKQDPQNAEAYFMFGMNFKDMGDTIRAINSFQSAVENDPDLVDAWIILGQLYEERGDPLALKYFENAVRVDSLNMTALHAKAVYLNNIGKSDEALEIYRNLHLKAPQYEDAYLNAGLILMDMDSIDAAYNEFNMLVNVSPISIPGFFYRGLASELKGNLEAAKEDYEQVLKFAPGNDRATEALERVTKQLQ